MMVEVRGQMSEFWPRTSYFSLPTSDLEKHETKYFQH